MSSIRLFFLAAWLLCLTGCSSHEETLRVAATAIPHAELLEHVRETLQDQGIFLEIIAVDDYNTPNRALNDGDIDANFFQHLPFLDAQIEAFGFALEPLAKTHIEPMGVYSKRWKQLQDLPQGAIIAIPNDPTNEGRALMLLHHAELIVLKDPGKLTATPLDIMDNPHYFVFKEIDAAMLVRTLPDTDAAVITSNFALQGDLSPNRDALVLEGPDSYYPNILVIRQGTENDPRLQALKAAMTSEEMRQFILQHYQGAILPAF